MYWLFIILSIFLLLYNLDFFTNPTHYAIVWAWKNLRLVRILPTNQFVLIDNDACFLYTDEENEKDETYASTIRLDTSRKYKVLHYRYLLDWILTVPIIVPFDSTKSLIEILNQVSKSLG